MKKEEENKEMESPEEPSNDTAIEAGNECMKKEEGQGKEKEPKPQLIAEPITLPLLIQNLLKEPLNISHSVRRNCKLPWAPLLFLTIGAFAMLGVIFGMFSGGQQLWAVPLKLASGIVFASLISLPSLFIFCCLCKVDATFKTIASILVCGVCISGLLILGFIPILWLFSTTSSSLAFFGFLALCTWMICLGVGLNFIHRSVMYLGAKNTGPIQLWFTIFTLVSLQMPTSLRPIIGESEETLINLKEKKFFLIHWGESLVDPPITDSYEDY